MIVEKLPKSGWLFESLVQTADVQEDALKEDPLLALLLHGVNHSMLLQFVQHHESQMPLSDAEKPSFPLDRKLQG